MQGSGKVLFMLGSIQVLGKQGPRGWGSDFIILLCWAVGESGDKMLTKKMVALIVFPSSMVPTLRIHKYLLI